MDNFNQQRRSQEQDPDDLLEISLGKRAEQPDTQPDTQSLNGRPQQPSSAETAEQLPQSDRLPDAETEDAPAVADTPASHRPALPVVVNDQPNEAATLVSYSDPSHSDFYSGTGKDPASLSSNDSVASDSAEEEPGENWFGILLRETIETIVLALVIFLLIRVGIQNYRIEGSSMEPNFHDGEYLLVNKLAYRLGEYKRGDVIVFHYPGDPSKDYIKRVIGLPGDTIEIRDQMLYVNGIPIDEPYETMPMSSFPSAPLVVQPGHLYVLGDNRPASSDTRDWGLLSEEFVIGKAWLAIFPIENFGLVEHPELHLSPTMAQGP